jgi:segregation and condensation protein B
MNLLNAQQVDEFMKEQLTSFAKNFSSRLEPREPEDKETKHLTEQDQIACNALIDDDDDDDDDEYDDEEEEEEEEEDDDDDGN